MPFFSNASVSADVHLWITISTTRSTYNKGKQI